MVRCSYNPALVLTCFRLKKGRDTYFRPETIVASFLHSMVLLPKVLSNHFWKRQFVVLHCHTHASDSWTYAIFMLRIVKFTSAVTNGTISLQNSQIGIIMYFYCIYLISLSLIEILWLDQYAHQIWFDFDEQIFYNVALYPTHYFMPGLWIKFVILRVHLKIK